MIKIKGIFAVSLIVLMTVLCDARNVAAAAIASQDYVDQEVGTRLSAISGSTSGLGNVVTSVSASGSTVSATKEITAEETKNKVTTVRATASATDTAYPSEKAVATALEGKADSADIPTKVSQLTNDSDFITADDLPEDYVLTAATATALGGVKSGGDISVATDGTVTVNSATNADKATTATSATKATQDGSGNVITSTYATKTELGEVSVVADSAASAASAAQTTATAAQNAINALDVSTATGSGNVVTSVTQTNGKISVSKGNVQIPVGSATSTSSYATIWVE